MRRGLNTGAYESRIGKFELAQKGTLFLDEIGEMHPDLQAKILRVIEEKKFMRIGSNRSVSVDVRLICATNRKLEDLQSSSSFRKDLFYRISNFPIVLPPLSERREDIPLLAEHILSKWRRELHNPRLSLSKEAIDFLIKENFPGNVRELFNRIERAAILVKGDVIKEEDLRGRAKPDPLTNLLSIEDPEEFLKEELKWRIKEVLKRCDGDKKRVCELLKIPVSKIEDPFKINFFVKGSYKIMLHFLKGDNEMDNETIEKRKPGRVGLIIFIVVVILVILGVILLIAGFSSLTKGPQIKVKPNSTLVIDLNKPLQEQPADPLSTQFFGAKVIQFCQLHDALKRAKDDDRIKSVLILPSMIPMSLAKAQELKNDIDELKKSKKVYAYFDMTGNTGYYIASSAEKIYAPPSAMLFLSGFYSEIPF